MTKIYEQHTVYQSGKPVFDDLQLPQVSELIIFKPYFPSLMIILPQTMQQLFFHKVKTIKILECAEGMGEPVQLWHSHEIPFPCELIMAHLDNFMQFLSYEVTRCPLQDPQTLNQWLLQPIEDIILLKRKFVASHHFEKGSAEMKSLYRLQPSCWVDYQIRKGSLSALKKVVVDRNLENYRLPLWQAPQMLLVQKGSLEGASSDGGLKPRLTWLQEQLIPEALSLYEKQLSLGRPNNDINDLK